MIKMLAKTAVVYTVMGAAMQYGADLYVNRKVYKAKMKKVINAVKN